MVKRIFITGKITCCDRRTAAVLGLALLCAITWRTAVHASEVQAPMGPAIASATYYVATNGNDAWSGSLAAPNTGKTDGPFASLAKAQAAVRELKQKKAPSQLITVLVRGGKYYLAEKVVFRGEDSGSRDFPITYKAYGEEKPILSGGRKITGWKPYKGKILKTEVPYVNGRTWKFRQLFLDGQRQIRARYPKPDPKNPLYGGWEFVAGPPVRRNTYGAWEFVTPPTIDSNEGGGSSFIYKEGAINHHWAKPSDGEVLCFPGGWNSDYFPIERIDENSRTIYLTRQPRDLYPEPWFGYSIPFSRGDRFRVENLLEDLDQPGEWCLDSEEGVLYFWPPSGTINPADEIVFPVLDTLIDIQGASWLDISGFTLTETTGGDDLHHLWVDGFGPMYPRAGWNYVGDTLHMQNAEHCIIENNHFDAVGGNAIYLERYNSHNSIRRNEIGYAGTNGISLLGNYFPVGSMVAMLHGKQPMPAYNEVVDNYIHHVGVFNKYVAGIYLGVSDGNLIAHNRIEDVPHHAISLGVNGFGRNIVEYNEIHRTSMEIAETSAINLWMDHAHSDERVGHIIRYNLMTDAEGVSTDPEGHFRMPDGSASGIYLDNNASNSMIYGNIIVRASSSGVYSHGGKNNFVENNIIVDSGRMSVRPSNPSCSEPLGQVAYTNNLKGEMFTGNRFSRNIVYYSQGKVPAPLYSFCAYDPGIQDWYTGQSPTLAIAVSDENLLFRSDGGEYWVVDGAGSIQAGGKVTNDPIKHLSLAEWQHLGFEQHSVIADPLFVDPTHDDYRLKSDSPALRLGFVPIDTSKIGIRPQ